MGKIVVTENVTLDGVVQDPAGDEGMPGGGWVGLVKDSPELGKILLDEALTAQAWLLGRRSYHWFAARWRSRQGPLADRINALPKYVLSATLHDPDWNHSTVLRGDPVQQAAALKARLSGDIFIPGSFQVVRALLAAGLVDELRLKIFPVALGAGERLFGEAGGGPKPLRLTASQVLEGSIACLTYQAV